MKFLSSPGFKKATAGLFIIIGGITGAMNVINEQKEAKRLDDMEEAIAKLQNDK